MSKHLTTVLLILSLLIGISTQAQDKRTGSEYTEHMLSTRAYFIPPGYDVVTWLKSLIQTIEAHSLENPSQQAVNLVLVGDAYHWIGHIFEERGEFALAWKAYLKSFLAYGATPLRQSAFITNHDTVGHARLHLAKVAPRIGEKMPTAQIVAAQQDNPILKNIDLYQNLLREMTGTVTKCSELF